MNRAYSVIEIKAVDEDARVITGIATTPRTDRMGDIVEPEGAEFKLPLPLLWQHRGDSPIGHVTEAKVTKDGIRITAKIEREDEPGELKNLLDKAWQSIRKGLVRGLSIGFAPIEAADIKGTWAQRFIKWEWLELSAVTIPANVDATIQTVKSYDEGAPAATGNGAPPTPPAPGHVVVKAITPKPEGGKMTIKEQIQQFEATRAAKAARMDELMKAAGEKGETLDETEAEEYDGLKEELVSIDKHLVRLNEQEAMNAEKAKAVQGNGTTGAGEARSVVVKAPEKLEPGIEFARLAMCLAAAKGDVSQALGLARTHYPQQVRAINVLERARSAGRTVSRYIEGMAEFHAKAAVPAGDTNDPTWAAPLVEFNQFAGDFVEFLRPRTIVGQFGVGSVPALRSIPFNVHIRGQTSGGTGYWVGQGLPKPVTRFDFVDTYHEWHKVAAISVLTEDLIRFSNPSAERLVRDSLAGAVIERLDSDFIDPAVAAVAGVNPASITNGVTPIGSTGTDGDAVRADIALLWAAPLAGNLPITSAVYITTPTIALNLSLMTNALGNREFPGMSMTGGTLGGIPVLVSNYVDSGLFILAFASEIYLSDDGMVTVDASREASLQMLDDPTNQSVSPTVPTTLVSMFQTNSVALRAERFITWSKRRTLAVQVLENVAWGPSAGSV